MNVIVNYTDDPEELEKLKDLAKARGVTVTSLLADAIGTVVNDPKTFLSLVGSLLTTGGEENGQEN